MGFYKSPEDIFSSHADRFKRDGDRHWAMAKTGYEQSATNHAKAEQAKANGATFAKRK